MSRWGWPPVRTAEQDMVWPALPSRQSAVLIGLLAQLEESQWLSPEALQAQQFRQLTLLVRHAYRTVPFYRFRLSEIGFDPQAEMMPERWQRLPPLQRGELQERGEALASGALPPLHGAVSHLQSSGSTGVPVRVRVSARVGLMQELLNIRNHLWHRRDLGQKLCIIRPPQAGMSAETAARMRDGLSSPHWTGLVAAIFETGPAASLHIQVPAERQLDWLVAQRPAYLLTMPANLRALLEAAQPDGAALPGLRQVLTLGEVVAPELRAACEAQWGVPICDVYSAVEAGFVALQCPEGEHYHVQSEVNLVEILDEDGRPCRPGEIGRVVVTPLHNFAMPLLRYALGDYAELGEPCACGRGLPVLRRILGRTRNMMRLPNGARVWPRLQQFGSALVERSPVRQFQLVQTAADALTLRLVALRPPSAAEERAIVDLAHAYFDSAFRVTLRYEAEIARGAGGKFEDFRCEV